MIPHQHQRATRAWLGQATALGPITILAWLALLPAVAHAQATIAGTVKDTSGAILPGVTVEATSPALIEKVRSAVTDGAGLYRIENLRPGAYTVTFSLPGFATVRREGLELNAFLTVTVNAELKVGGVEETITVTGETPVVDVQSARRQTVLTNEVISAIPTVGSYNALLVLVPAIFGGQQDVSTGPCNSCTFSSHGTLLDGGRANREARLLVDGISIAVPQAGGTNYLTDTRNAQEVSFTTSGSLGEVESGGPVMNIVPKSGGNTLSGGIFTTWGNGALQGSNYSDELKAAGLTAPNPLIKAYDFNNSAGGPISRDRLWFFGTLRFQGNSNYIVNMYENKNAGDPNKWTYEPDLNRQAFKDQTWQNASARITAQLSPRNKVNVFWDEQKVCQKCVNGGLAANATTSPEANTYADLGPMRFQQATYSSPVSSKFLLEGGFGYFFSRWGGRAKEDPNTNNFVRMVEQCTAGCPVNGNIAGLNYRSQTLNVFSDSRNKNITYTWRAAGAYVTGSRSFKFGYTGTMLGVLNLTNRSGNNLQYRVNNGVPNQLTEFINNFEQKLWMRNDAFFAQEQWTIDRLTLQGALRYDHSWSWAPPQHIGPERFLPTPLDFAERPVVDAYHDLTPRLAATYDLFGNGKTALKATLGKYLDAATTASNYGLSNPTSRIPQNVARTWTDADGDFAPDCDLLNPDAQDLRPTGGDACGAYANRNFGTAVFSNTIDPDILSGWGVRPSDWQVGFSVQHEVVPRVSVEVGYFLRWFQGFTVTDNLAVTAADFDQFSVTAPADPRLPGGGNYTLSGFYDVKPALFGATDNFITYSDKYGKQYQRFHGVDVTASARPGNGLTIQGGVSWGRSTADSCEIRDKVPETATLNPWCHIVTGQLPQYKTVGSYVVPKVDVQTSVTFTSKPGIQVSQFGTPAGGGALAANYTVSNAVVAQSLGRNLSGNTPNVTVNLIEPHTLLGDRVNEMDIRVGKIVRFGKSRVNVGFDVYNLLNSSAVLSYNQAFIPNGRWLTPTSVMTARFAKVSAQFDF
jgi:Carboxypeptidase regulatory-like domain